MIWRDTAGSIDEAHVPPVDRWAGRVCRRPPGARFADVRRLLEAFGWALDECEGSHCVVRKPRVNPISVPQRNKKVKRRYRDLICERLDLDAE